MPDTLALLWSRPPSTLRERSTTRSASPSAAVSWLSLLVSVSTLRSAMRVRSGAGAASIDAHGRVSLLQNVRRVTPAPPSPTANSSFGAPGRAAQALLVYTIVASGRGATVGLLLAKGLS
jgi:hypothetical protein